MSFDRLAVGKGFVATAGDLDRTRGRCVQQSDGTLRRSKTVGRIKYNKRVSRYEKKGRKACKSRRTYFQRSSIFTRSSKIRPRYVLCARRVVDWCGRRVMVVNSFKIRSESLRSLRELIALYSV